MDEYVDFQEFSSFEPASRLMSLLRKNDIPFEFDDSALKFSIAPVETAYSIVRIRGQDVQKANELIEHTNKIDNNHYLFTFSDSDLIDVVANPEDWTNKEVAMAQSIIKQKGINVTAEDIRLAREKSLSGKKRYKKKESVNKSYNWFIAIGLLSIINSILIATKSGVHFIFGLGYTQVIDSVFFAIFKDFTMIGLLISSLMASFFIILWYYAKLNNKRVYLIGIIIYGLDMLIFIYSKDWLSTGFHIYALIFLIRGYLKILETQEKKLPNII